MLRAAAVEFEHRLARIKLLLMDCDGVLTDGRITLIGEADERKSFHTRDGHGLVLLHRAGLRSGIISGNRSSVVERRAADLKITFVHQGAWDKIAAYKEVLAEAGVEESEVAFIGDDVTDAPIMLRVGCAFAVADAVEETQRVAHYVTQKAGGFGAVREVCEMILRAQGRWTELMRRYFEAEAKV
jgi:3-deoxy-D-manno-octulosonate 8-phosphate phosphatase (KDO 8-P phosphatase)